MADFNIRSDSVDVEQIMKQIRTRIQEKRGVDYTEEQVRELATVRLEKFLDPKNLRSDLLEQFRRSRPPLPEIPTEMVELPDPPKDPSPPEPPYEFDAETLYQSHRGSLRRIRQWLAPIFKLFFNPNTLVQILFKQSQFNMDMLKRDLRRRVEFEQGLYELHVLQARFQLQSQQQTASFERSRAEWNLLYYEVLHNLVFETTRNGIEAKNLRMRVEALASRLDFSERRVRALEGVVQYRPEVVRSRPPQGQARPERVEGRDRDRDRDRDKDRGRERPPRVEADAAEPVAEANVAPAANSAASGPAQAQNAQAPSGEAVSRRRRRRRRGRRGAGLPGATPGAVDQPAEADNDLGDEDFAEGDELETAVDETVRFEEAAEDSASTNDAGERINAARDGSLGPDDSGSEGPDAADSAATKTDPDRQ